MKVISILQAAVLLCAAAPLISCAAEPGEEAVVVYNNRMPESKGVAEYYAKKRHVPASQVFGFDLPTTEDISRGLYTAELQQPLLDALQRKQLWSFGFRRVPAANGAPARTELAVTQSKIRYVVLCYGVPLRIASDPGLKEEGMEKLRPELRRNEAAVDSELSLLPLIQQKPPLYGALRNPVFGATNTAWLHPTNGVLLVARLDGPSAEIARGLVDKAMEAETNGLWGRAYFDLRDTTEPGYKMGDDWIRSASEIAKRLGFETVVDDNPGTFPAAFPMSQIGLYIGWYDQDASGPFTRPNVEFMPGAFAYHLHSFSACTLRSTTKAWAGPLLAKGATATLGCVAEPYLSGTPEIAVFTARFIFSGMSFGEASYACQPVLSWQTTVVGDPLYRPFGRNPEQLHEDLMKRHSPFLEWSYLRLVNLNLANGRSLDECVGLLERIELTKKSAVLTEKLGDLYAAQGKPSSAVFAYTEALNLGPSPEQRVRLRLTLGDRLIALNRQPEAYQDLQKLLAEQPDYPDKIGLYRKLLSLAQKLHKTAELEKYETEIGRLAAPAKTQARS